MANGWRVTISAVTEDSLRVGEVTTFSRVVEFDPTNGVSALLATPPKAKRVRHPRPAAVKP